MVTRSLHWVALALCLLGTSASVFAAPTVGAYYYPWWGDGIACGHAFRKTLRAHTTPEAQLPKVGVYHSRDAEVISAHIDQSHLGNISMWSLSWWGPCSFEDITIRHHILKHPRAAELVYTVNYETKGRLGNHKSPDYSNLIPDFQYLAKYVFSDPNYMRHEGRPVVVIYLSRVYFDEAASWAELKKLRKTIQRQFGYELYIIGDHIFRGVADGAEHFDAITGYDVYGQVFRGGRANQSNIDGLKAAYEKAQKHANGKGVDFVPTVIPGFNDKGVRKANTPIGRYLNSLGPSAPGSLMKAILTDAVLPHTDADIDDLILVNSFNEWHEDTQVEATIVSPSTNTDDSTAGARFSEGRFYEGYGTRYLDMLRSLTDPQGASPAAAEDRVPSSR
ncbi:MAG: glycoside hydrolase family 99-like domain-containing protein [Pirellulales bacterium]|nr:glycoside hydrolase family 99-like domain-containing protein [Pirellulales bacterium]